MAIASRDALNCDALRQLKSDLGHESVVGGSWHLLRITVAFRCPTYPRMTRINAKAAAVMLFSFRFMQPEPCCDRRSGLIHLLVLL